MTMVIDAMDILYSGNVTVSVSSPATAIYPLAMRRSQYVRDWYGRIQTLPPSQKRATIHPSESDFEKRCLSKSDLELREDFSPLQRQADDANR
ncbi:MAG: hypothetical protein ACLURV_13495 [Gallintestinimicrobium sp.]